MNKIPVPKLSEDAKKKINDSIFDLFIGLTWHIWMSGKTLGAAWTEAYGMTKSFIAGKEKSNPNNPAVQHMKEAMVSKLSSFLKSAMVGPTKDDKMNVPKEQYDKYYAMGVKWVNQGKDGMNEQIKAVEPKEAAKQPHTLTPEQIKKMIMNQYMQRAA